MARKLTNIMVTGGCGFIGCNFIRYVLHRDDFKGRIINVDKLTYAGKLENVADIDKEFGGSRYFFEKADICDTPTILEIFDKYDIDTVVHFAAESHVDRSITGPQEFVQTNVIGTFSLLEASRKQWHDRNDVLFHHVSTDEVYGSLGEDGYFLETTPYDPRSPYSASKAASDHFVRAYHHTYALPATISNCSNNYGPYQDREKLIPLMITNMIKRKPLPVYGDGNNIRDWVYVQDHVEGLWLVLSKGRSGQSYNIGGGNEWRNIDLVRSLCKVVASCLGIENIVFEKLIHFVHDRPGHDRRYAIDSHKIRNEIGWSPTTSFEEGLHVTARHFLGMM